MPRETPLLDFSLRVIGFITLLIGSFLTYLSLRTEVGVTDPRLFTPVGVIISLIGVFLITARVR